MTIYQQYVFFRCTFCGSWYYSNKSLKSKKCWKCNRTFQFKRAFKFSKYCSVNEAIMIIKELKKGSKKETLTNYINRDKNLSLI